MGWRANPLIFYGVRYVQCLEIFKQNKQTKEQTKNSSGAFIHEPVNLGVLSRTLPDAFETAVVKPQQKKKIKT